MDQKKFNKSGCVDDHVLGAIFKDGDFNEKKECFQKENEFKKV